MLTTHMKILCSMLCLVILVNFAGCIFVPKTVDSGENKCRLVTKQLTVGVVTAQGSSFSACSVPECILVVLGISTASLAVSGSIVVVGNTIHWIEGQGKCDDSATKKAIERLKASTKNACGVAINTMADATNWLKSLASTTHN